MTTIANLKGRDIKREEIQTWKESSLYSSQTRANSMAHALTTEKPNQMNGTGGILKCMYPPYALLQKKLGSAVLTSTPEALFLVRFSMTFHDVHAGLMVVCRSPLGSRFLNKFAFLQLCGKPLRFRAQ